MFSEKRSLSQLIRLALLLGACTTCLNVHANTPSNQASYGSAKSATDSLQQFRGAYSFKLAEKDDDCIEEDGSSGTVASSGKSMDGIMLAALSNSGKGASTKDAVQSAKTQQQDSIRSAPSEKAAPQTWEISPTDKTLNAALARWTAIAGWQLSWELPVDYSVEVKTVVPGTFEEAVELVTKSMDTAEIPMKAIFYNGNKVLRIVQKGTK